MRLTQYTDYGLRVLIYLAVCDDIASVNEIAQRFNVAFNHLNKVANELVKLGYAKSTRGRTGGLQLAIAPEEIVVGHVVRQLEQHTDIVECFDPETNTCPIGEVCRLKNLLDGARSAFFTHLDQFTLADITRNRRKLGKTLVSD